MALCRPDIIGAHPIGDALTSFRDAYNSKCEKLGLPPSIEAIAQLSDKGKSTKYLPDVYIDLYRF